MYKGTRLGHLEKLADSPIVSAVAVSPTAPEDSTLTGAPDAALWELVAQCNDKGDRLDPSQQEQLMQVLQKHRKAFAAGRVQHHIHTGDSPPIRQAPRWIPVRQREEAHKNLADMLERKIVSPFNSPWSSPVVLVRKTDGSLRFCIDYRKLNAVTRKDAYPLPPIDETLDTLAGSRWFSTLDLLSGYWQVEIAQADKEKTAFCVPDELFQFNVMPFGLCNAPATFQRLMDTVLAGLQWERCLVYLEEHHHSGEDIRGSHCCAQPSPGAVGAGRPEVEAFKMPPLLSTSELLGTHRVRVGYCNRPIENSEDSYLADP